jgi:quercetin 2,3-dioxygenase
MKQVAEVMRSSGGHWVGDGFPVRSLFSYQGDTAALSPFLLFDYAGPHVFEPAAKPRGVGKHPHRGFETVTIVYDGEVSHRDSTGGGGTIGPGDVQWMTAAGGIIHEEFHSPAYAAKGGPFHMVQLWVNLPAKDKMIPPAYQGLEADQVTLLSSEDGGALLRVIAGEVGGHLGPGSTHTPMALVHATISPGARLQLPWNATFNALVYVLAGSGRAGAEGRPVTSGQLVVFGAGDFISVRAADRQESRSGHLELLVLGGRPIGEPVATYGPFVMNTRAELQQAMEDFQAGRLGSIPPDAPAAKPVRAENTGI